MSGCQLRLFSLCAPSPPPSLGDFVVDDDGAGYVDIGEEDDWAAEDGDRPDKKDKKAKKDKGAR